MYAQFAHQQPHFAAARRPPSGTSAGFLGTLGRADLLPFRGPKDTLEKMAEFVLGDAGERSLLVRQFTEWVVRGVHPKDYLGQILAIRNAFAQPSPWRQNVPLFSYTNDPRHVELVKTPERMVREIQEHGTMLGDCDDYSVMSSTMCLQVGRNVDLVALGFAPNTLSHVGARAEEPKSGAWIWMDGVAGPREAEASAKAKELLVLSLD